MEKFTRVIAKEDIKTFDDAGIAQLGNLNKIIDEVNTIVAAPGPPGAPGFVWEGVWSNGTVYQQSDVVFYNGSSYFCTQDVGPSNTTPNSDPAHWSLFAAQGQQGVQGTQGAQGIAGTPGPVGPAGLTWEGTWAAGTTYQINDAVAYNGASYFCISPITGNPANTNPSVDTVHWALLAAQGAQGPQGIQGIQGLQGATGPQGPQGPAGTANLLLGNAVYVSKTGNNATGTRNNLALPFQTIEAAAAAAQTEDTIVVFPGSYQLSTGIVLRDNVHFYFLGVGILTLAAGIESYLFSDQLSASAVNCTIYAPGWRFQGVGFTGNSVSGSPGTLGCRRGVISLFQASTVNFTVHTAISEDSVIFLYGDEGTSTADISDNPAISSYVGATVPKIKVVAHTIRKTGTSSVNNPVWCSTISARWCQIDVTAENIIQDAPFDAYYGGCVVIGLSEFTSITANKIINYGEDGLCVYINNCSINDKIYLNANQVSSGHGWTIYLYSDHYTNVDYINPQLYARVARVDSKGDCAVVANGGSLTIEGASIYYDNNTLTDGIIHSESTSFLTAIGCKIYRTATSTLGYDVRASGKAYLVNTVYDKKKIITTTLGLNIGEIYHWNGSDFVAYKEVTLTSAQISTLNTVPVELLPAPTNGATQYYVIDRILCEITAGTPGAVTANVALIKDSYFNYAYLDSTFFSFSNNISQFAVLTPSPSSNSGLNQLIYPQGQLQNLSLRSVKLSMNIGNPTGITTQTMKVKIWYRLETAG